MDNLAISDEKILVALHLCYDLKQTTRYVCQTHIFHNLHLC